MARRAGAALPRIGGGFTRLPCWQRSLEGCDGGILGPRWRAAVAAQQCAANAPHRSTPLFEG
eukprot:10361977-Lingulodinium_polyedra.AAC.1